jgi:O-antigen/teichoic acid export membrane protein
MRKANKSQWFRLPVFLVAAACLLLFPMPALAYLDPTTGSMLISAIVGLFASLVLAIKTYWYRLKAFFKRKPAESDTDDGAA